MKYFRRRVKKFEKGDLFNPEVTDPYTGAAQVAGGVIGNFDKKDQYGVSNTPGVGIASNALKYGALGASVGGPIGALAGGALGVGMSLIEQKQAEEARKTAKSQEYNNILNNSQGVLAQYPSSGIPRGKYGMMYAEGGNLPMPTDGSGKEQLASNIAQYHGANHEQGGIDLDTNQDGQQDIEVENQEVIKDNMVLSDRMKPTDNIKNYVKQLGISFQEGDTYASIADRLGKKKGNWEAKLKSSLIGEVNSAKRMIQKLDQSIDLLFQDQQSQKVMEDQEKFMNGGRYKNKRQRIGGRYRQKRLINNFDGSFAEGGEFGKGPKPLYQQGDPTFKRKADHDAFYVKRATQLMQQENPAKYEDFQLQHNTLDAGKDVGAGLSVLMSEYDFPQYQQRPDYKFPIYYQSYAKPGSESFQQDSAIINNVNPSSKYQRKAGYRYSAGKPAEGSITKYAPGGTFKDYLKDNDGNIANVAGYIGNQSYINNLNTQFTPELATAPVNNYTDRTAYLKNLNEAEFNTASRGINTGSQQDNNALKSSMYGQTLNANNAAISQEQARKDQYSQHFQQMLQYNNMYNAQAINQAKQVSFNAQNEKTALGQNNYDNLIRGQLSNIANKEQRAVDDKQYTAYMKAIEENRNAEIFKTKLGLLPGMNDGVSKRIMNNAIFNDEERKNYFGQERKENINKEVYSPSSKSINDKTNDISERAFNNILKKKYKFRFKSNPPFNTNYDFNNRGLNSYPNDPSFSIESRFNKQYAN